jgi:hypothetical protein
MLSVMPRVLRASEKVQTTIVKGGELSMSFQLKALVELSLKALTKKLSNPFKVKSFSTLEQD